MLSRRAVNKKVASNNTAKLSTRTGLIYTQDRKWDDENKVNAYYFVAHDFRTGEVVWEKLVGTGCQATIAGTGTQFESPAVVVDELGGMLEEQGWTADPMLGADGPTGTAMGYRKDDQICWASAMWTPDASANCPADQPISACELTAEQQIYTVILNIGNHKLHVR